MIRVLNVTEVFQAAGIESFIMNMYRHIDRSKVQFDFFVMNDEKEIYDDEIAVLGGRKFTCKVNQSNTLLRILAEAKQLEKFLKNNHYDIVHIHYTTPLRAFYLKACLNANVKIRIYHSHSAYVSGKGKVKTLVYNYLKNKISKWGTHYFACSHVAAQWMFSEDIIKNEKYKVIYNGIDPKRFAYDEIKRKKIREELALKDDFVIVHTGRFSPQKNQSFLIDLFANFKQKYPCTKLLLLGQGEMLESLKIKVKTMNLSDSILFLNVRKDVDYILSGADCYVMPSLYEGLPVAAIEAQCSDLPCVLSTEITRETKLLDKVEFVALNASQDEWIKAIESCMQHQRSNQINTIQANGYDVSLGAMKLQSFYEHVLEGKDYE